MNNEKNFEKIVSEIKNKINILDVVQPYVILTKKGDNYWGCCPFHNEIIPSFSVNPKLGIYKCFSCGEGGDAFTFLMKINNKSFNEVIKDLSGKFNIELPDKNDEETILTGFKELDELTGGLKKGELVLIGGNPSYDKTAFASHIASYNSGNNNRGCFITNHDSKDINKAEYQEVFANFQNENELKPVINQFKEIRLRLLNYKKQQNDEEYLNKFGELNFLIIDEIKPDKDLLEYLKNIAKELNVSVVVFSPLSKSVENKGDKHPLITDLKITKTRELPIDKLLFIYRDDYYDLSNPEKWGTAEIIVAKNNNGETGTVNLLFDKEKQKFWNIEENVFVFNQILSVGKNSFTAKYGDYWFEIDTNGKLLYKMKCQNLRRISNDLLIAKINNKEGLIDNDFNVIAGFEYSDFKTLDKNFEYFKFRKNKKWGVVDKQGKFIIEPKYSKIERADKDFNYMFVTTGEEEFLIDRQENIVDEETTERLICTPEFIENFQISEKPDWRIVEIKGKYGLVDKEFNQLKVNIDKTDKIPEIIVF